MSKLWEIVEDRGAYSLWGFAKSRMQQLNNSACAGIALAHTRQCTLVTQLPHMGPGTNMNTPHVCPCTHR